MKKLILLLSIVGVAFTQAQTITLISPESGTVWNTGTSQLIKWTSSGVSNLNIDYSTDGGISWNNIATSLPGTATVYSWTVTGPVSLACFIRVSSSSNANVFGQNSTAFIIGPIATVVATIQGPDSTSLGDTTICPGSPVQLLATGQVYTNAGGGGPPPPPPGLNYSWSPTTGLNNPNLANPIARPTTTTIYTVTGDDGEGDTAVSSVTVNVRSSPQLTLMATHDTSNAFRQDTLFASVTPPGQTINYQFGVDPGVFGIYTLQSYGSRNWFNYSYPDTILCVATDDFGCTDTASVTIHTKLRAYIDTIIPSTCHGTNGNGAFYYTVIGGSGGPPWTGDSGDTLEQYGTNISGGDGELSIGIVWDTAGDDIRVFAYIPLLDSLSLSTQVFSDGVYPDSIQAVTINGISPFVYAWSNSDAASDIDTVYKGGMYTCTVTDKNGCSAVASAEAPGSVLHSDFYRVPENATASLNVLLNDTFPNDFNLEPFLTYVSIPAHGTAGIDFVSPVTYTPADNYIGPDSFYYVVCLGDSAIHNSYCDTAEVYLNVVDSILITFTGVHPPSCNNSCDGSLTAQVSGGVQGYTYSWSGPSGFTSSSVSPSGLCPGTYRVVVSDGSTTGSASITISSSANLQIRQYDDTAYAFISGSSSPWTFSWSTGKVDSSTIYGSVINTSTVSVYCVTATSSTGSCILSVCDTIGCFGCVWPGDANEDGLANNLDLLSIGLGYGDSGIVRPNATNGWYGQPCNDWADTIPSGLNAKYTDCNGDGIIDANDTLPLVLNYGLSHAKSGAVRDWKQGQPALYVTITPDSLVNGETMTATFSLGDQALPAVNIYGFKFTYNYDPLVIDSTKTHISFPDSWFGNATNKISIARDFPSLGQMQCALTRIDHTTVSGSGPIGMATFIITTDNINGKDELSHALQTWISDLTAIDSLGNPLQFNEGGDTAKVVYFITGTGNLNADAEIKLFPNPVHDQLVIQSQNMASMKEITLFDLLGNSILTQTVTQPYQTAIDVSSLSSGAYFVQVKTSSGTVMKRFVVAR